MKLLIFGSTGGTGRELLKQALDKGHEITVFVRDPARLGDIGHANLKTVTGDVLDPEAVQKSVPGHDVVLVAIGAGAQRSTLREEGTRNIMKAMEDSGVKRLVCQSSLGVGESHSNLDLFTRHIVVGIFLRHAFADHARQEALIRQSTLDWTIVRPPHLVNGPRTGTYRHGFPATDRRIKGKVSRADVAEFMLAQVDDDTYLRRAPGISY